MRDAAAKDARRDDASDVVVYDFDGTLVEGDIGAAFIHHLLRGWRRGVAMPLATPGLALMRFERTRRLGVSMFLRVASLGRSYDDIHAAAERFAEARTIRRREREIGWLRADLAAGHRVVVATGAFEPLARVVLRGLGLEGSVTLVASRLADGPLGPRVLRHCNGEAKLRALAEDGFPPPYAKAVSDSWADAPLLRAAREAVMVNASPRSRDALRRAIGERLIDADNAAPARGATS